MRALAACVLLLIASASPAAAEPPRWGEQAGKVELAVGAAQSVSSVTSPFGLTVEAAWIRRRPFPDRKSPFGVVGLIFLGNERGVRLRARALDDSVLAPERAPEVTISARIHLGVAAPWGRLRGPAYLGAIAPELGVVFDGDGAPRAIHYGAVHLPLARLLRAGFALAFELEVAAVLPLDGRDDAMVFTLGAAVVQL